MLRFENDVIISRPFARPKLQVKESNPKRNIKRKRSYKPAQKRVKRLLKNGHPSVVITIDSKPVSAD